MTEEEFKKRALRASRLASERSQGLSRVRAALLARFQNEYPLAEIFVIDQRDVDYRAYLFWVSDQDLKKYKGSGVEEKLKKAIIEELALVGRVVTPERLDVEFDSDENVQRTCDGDYLMRLK